MRQVIVFKTNDGDWIAYCPSLPGCKRQGATKPEAIEAIREAVQDYIRELKQHRAPVPEDQFEAAIVYV